MLLEYRVIFSERSLFVGRVLRLRLPPHISRSRATWFHLATEASIDAT